ncbi:DUF1800 family protein [Uliginosibacterium sp. 31-12]|uniref:DUF1800 domain-containing protein n=1 Tax=Uliginosibacterium sp. 31-12 TaxID=3062781 RepID=UPI0026E26CE6|nr:DUF1800 family protein [Uliginosibacterium sp. 31-12]MDO6387871.1 DUF1800 family protein [Uliginosibacterium sp. 31-12]
MDRIIRLGGALLLTTLLAACGGGGGGGSSSGSSGAGGSSGGAASSTGAAAASSSSKPGASVPAPAPLAAGEAAPSEADAVRFLTQASFGPTVRDLAVVRGSGFRNWLVAQMMAAGDNYSAYSTAVHTTGLKDFCAEYGAFPSEYYRKNCWQEYYSAEPLSREFYVSALSGADQLRQRVALALGQIFVVSNSEVSGTYGLRDYHQMLLDQSFGNVRELLGAVSRNPAMADYLNLVNNEKAAPNENFARELMQLFSIGLCELTADGRLAGGSCRPTYDNNIVREVAFALTGWTYPAGGVSAWGSSGWKNPTYYRGQLLAVPAQHDTAERSLPGGGKLGGGHTPAQAMDAVLNALFQHPNIAPFIGKQLIQHLVTSNPSPAYVGRVSQAFASGTAFGIGSGQRGDMKAIIAAILLDSEARGDSKSATDYGRLREPAQFIAGLLRAMNTSSDGAGFYYWWGEEFGQAIFNANSVFNFYPPDFPLAGTSLVGPAFAIENPNSTLARYNLSNRMLYWNGLAAGGFPGASGSTADISSWLPLADNASSLVSEIERLLVTGGLPADIRSGIVDAVAAWPVSTTSSSWRTERVRTAFYLILASPEYQVQR